MLERKRVHEDGHLVILQGVRQVHAADAEVDHVNAGRQPAAREAPDDRHSETVVAQEHIADPGHEDALLDLLAHSRVVVERLHLLGREEEAVTDLSLLPQVAPRIVLHRDGDLYLSLHALHELLRRAGGFALSLLADGQDWLAQHFARGVPPIALWHGIASREGAAGAPLLVGALGWLECRLADEVPAGDHTFFVGEVLAAELGEPAPPLVHIESGYRSL